MIDCHLHLQDPRLRPFIGGIMETVRSSGITRLVVNGTHPGDWLRVRELSRRFPEVIPSFGLHPWHVGSEPGDWLDSLETLLGEEAGACVGEIGLDRWIRGNDPAKQEMAFLQQLRLADTFGRSVTIHCLKAWGTLMDLIRKHRPRTPFLLHSYGGPAEMVPKFAELGAFFSLSGYFFREDKAGKLAAFDRVPSNRLLIETDAPDMPPPAGLLRFRVPQNSSGEEAEMPNHPANLLSIRSAAATRLGMVPAEFDALIAENFAAWYHGPAA